MEDASRRGVAAFRDFEDLRTRFRAFFQDPNLSNNSKDAILSMVMKEDDNVIFHILKFQSLAAESDFNDVALRKLLHRSLSRQIKDALVYIPNLPKGLHDFIHLVHQVDLNLSQNRIDRGNYKRSQNASRMHVTGSPTLTPTVPMQIDSLTEKPKSVSRGSAKIPAPGQHLGDDEKKRRKENNLCHYCGSDKHLLSGCDLAKNFSILVFLLL